MNEEDPHYKGMTTEKASLKKISGHINEYDYASVINGKVIEHTGTDKADVSDSQRRNHSVKSGKKWQIFLYSKERLETNTMLRGIGEVAPRLLGCLNSLPSTRKEREANKDAAKKALMYPMRALAEEISKPRILRAFMMKAVFDSDRVDYLAILPHEIDQIMTNIDGKYFHVFDAKETVDAICKHIKVENSKARGRGQYDDQKVVFWDKYNIGEIEVRTDKFHYGRIKMWFDARRVLDMLNVRIPETSHEYRRLILYGKARRLKI